MPSHGYGKRAMAVAAFMQECLTMHGEYPTGHTIQAWFQADSEEERNYATEHG